MPEQNLAPPTAAPKPDDVADGGSRRRAQVVPDWLFARPRRLMAVLLLLLALGLSQIPRLGFESGMDVFYNPHSALRQVLDEVNKHFVNDELIFILYSAPDIFSRDTLKVVRHLGERLEAIKTQAPSGDFFPVDKVTSLTNVKDLEGSEMSFQAVSLVPDPLDDKSEWNPATARKRVENNPLLRDGFISDDGRSALMVLRLSAGISDPQRNFLVKETRALLAATQSQHPKLSFHLAGSPIFNTDMADYQAQDLMVFVPLGYGLMALLVFFFVRRVRGLIFAFATVSLGFVIGLGTLAAIGSSLNNCSVMLPPIVIALTAAMLLHFLSEYAKNAHQVGLKNPARHTLGELLEPAAIAAFTTAIGFAALAVSHVPAVHQFGIASAIALTLIFVVVVLMFVLVTRKYDVELLVSAKGFAASPRIDAALNRLARWVERWRWALLITCLTYAVLIGWGISRIVVDNNNLGMFSPQAPIRQATEYLDQQIGGTTTLVVSLKHREPGHFLQPQALAKVEALTTFLRQDLGAQRSTSAADFIKLMHRAFFADDPAAYRLPQTAEQTAQLLLLNGDTRIDEYLDAGQSWTRVEARVALHSSTELDQSYQKIEAYLAQHFTQADGYQAQATGLARLEADMVNQLINSQVQGFLLSVVLIFGLLFIMFRSLRVGVLSLWPNIFPITSNLGLMGWLGIRLDASTVMISSVALGIAVDDTVHFIQGVRDELRVHGDLSRAVRETFRVKGPAIIWTSVVISLGFCVSIVSNFGPTRNFGMLVGLTMTTALVGDLILLPALILVLKSHLGVRAAKPESEK